MIINFNTEENRLDISRQFYINPLTYSRIFEEMRSECLNRKLTYACYVIELVRKSDISKRTVHIMGYKSAEDLLKFAKKNRLPLYNPITDDTEASENGRSSSSENKQILNKFTKLNKEAYKAVNLLLLFTNIKMSNIKGNWGEILKYSQKENDINHSLVKGFNTTLKSFGSMKEICSKITEKGYGKVKNHEFPEMRKILVQVYNFTDEEILL